MARPLCQVWILVALLSGCATIEMPVVETPAVVSAPEPAQATDLSDMVFPFPFRGVKYQMAVRGGQSGDVEVTPDRRVDEATAKDAALNACAFIGRFPDAKATGALSSESWDWMFEHACL